MAIAKISVSTSTSGMWPLKENSPITGNTMVNAARCQMKMP